MRRSHYERARAERLRAEEDRRILEDVERRNRELEEELRDLVKSHLQPVAPPPGETDGR